MAEVPATAVSRTIPGQLISEGININVTLLFSWTITRKSSAYIADSKTPGETRASLLVASFFRRELIRRLTRKLEEN